MTKQKDVSYEDTNNTDLYVYENTIFNSSRYFSASEVEPDYVYHDPEVINVGNDYKVIINNDETQIELVDSSSGLWQSVGIVNDSEIIRHLINILDFHWDKLLEV